MHDADRKVLVPDVDDSNLTIAAGLTDTSYTDTTARQGRTYYYTVEATNAASTSAASLSVEGEGWSAVPDAAQLERALAEYRARA